VVDFLVALERLPLLFFATFFAATERFRLIVADLRLRVAAAFFAAAERVARVRPAIDFLPPRREAWWVSGWP
jgi:hypothetical protein